MNKPRIMFAGGSGFSGQSLAAVNERGFEFQFPALPAALDDLLRRRK